MMRSPIGPLLLAFALVLSGCATAERTPFTESEILSAQIPDMENVRYWMDEPGLGARLVPPTAEPGIPITELVLSGGGDRGAYGAGFLSGWSETGERPQFTIVTGVSTGALIATFAFLGPQYDPHLAAAYTEIEPEDVYSVRFPLAIPFSNSAASTEPLAELIASYATNQVIDLVAAEQAKGRRLYVTTTSFDAARGVVWDMGAIAASNAPGRYRLFRQVLLASSSVPTVFPPVPIETRVNGRIIREWHVDGGSSGGLFAIPLRPEAGAERQIFVLVNERLSGDFQLVESSILQIARRASELGVQKDLRTQAEVAFRNARDNGTLYRLSFIGDDFVEENHDYFAQDFMRELFAYGKERGRQAAWVNSVPRGTGGRIMRGERPVSTGSE
ncbi:putative acylesterase/phospholipase RssA [Altererythrobacter atlanticus]|uniref:Patatin-like phospholipase n=1 Tax=Croceibacterium atlanticum TaxID=1267766 RepID=A0A0F7KR64_9SPHN|nr:patatin-like phospholipase family protein [Croceibacterium atlanticum]AKH42968.1 Patatin-like phospholipase [Croceibacterium atlanticum]MBB5734075.1 putative acylesterase/phospholipase RssA [Croceibacterium atlanticum]